MHCQSCKENISTKFTHAIQSNTCPFCGSLIMDEKLQTILKHMKILFDDGKEYVTEIEDWLFTNYSLKKFDPKEATNYFQGGITPTIGHLKNTNMVDQVLANGSINDATVPPNIFQQRAGIKKQALTHQELMDKIQNGAGAADPSQFSGVDDEYGEMATEDTLIVPLDGRAQNEMQGLFDNGDSKVLELERLKRLRSRIAGNGSFTRNGD